jgi:uncharacterized secreted protein with C-terminal beta-propeller domain
MKIAKANYLVTALLFLAACNNGSEPPTVIEQVDTPISQAALKPLQNCSALREKLIGNWVENLVSYHRYMPNQLNEAPILSVQQDGLLSSAGSGIADPQPDDVSETNNQEAGVDEADQVKSDSLGNLYIAQHNKLIIADAWPPQSMNIRSTLELDGPVSGLYLSEQDNLIVALVSEPFVFPINTIVADAIAPYIWRNPKTNLVFIDISNKEKPSIKRRLRLDGQLISSRASNGRLHLVQGFYLDRYIYAENADVKSLLADFHQAFVDGDENDMASIKARLRLHISNNLNIDDIAALLPAYQTIDANQNGPSNTLPCNNIYAPIIDTRDNHVLMVTSVDINGDDIHRAAVIGSGWTVYASQQDLFIVQPSFSWWWRPHQQQQSAIHHFAISARQPAYLSTGLVKGYVNDSFSLSYFEDHLRVATTQNFWNLSDRSDIRSTNHLYVLADNRNKSMAVVGSVNNYADNERIFSARFIKDKGFVVTFRQIDPLFSFDLSDPSKPFIAGELKIPGFSSYMHPIDDNYLLTIGRDGNGIGASEQIAIKLFDVSDLAHPLLVDSYTPELGDGYSWSQANWDHHAFSYYQSKQLLAVPLSSYHANNDDYFMGMLILNVDTDLGLSLAGTVDHLDLLKQINCSTTFVYCDKYYYRWLSQPTRSIFMTRQSDSYYYSLSNIGLKAVNTNDFDTTAGSLLLGAPENYYQLYY